MVLFWRAFEEEPAADEAVLSVPHNNSFTSHGAADRAGSVMV
jgi:hypothetical protein